MMFVSQCDFLIFIREKQLKKFNLDTKSCCIVLKLLHAALVSPQDQVAPMRARRGR